MAITLRQPTTPLPAIHPEVTAFSSTLEGSTVVIRNILGMIADMCGRACVHVESASPITVSADQAMITNHRWCFICNE